MLAVRASAPSEEASAPSGQASARSGQASAPLGPRSTNDSASYSYPLHWLPDLPPTTPGDPHHYGKDRLAQALREAAQYMEKQVDLPSEISIGQRRQQSLAELLGSEEKTRFPDKDDSLDVTITKFDTRAPSTVEMKSIDKLFDALESDQFRSTSRVVCVNGLSSAAVGLLGSMLKIDPYFFALHLNTGPVSESSALQAGDRLQFDNRFMKFRYKRLDVHQRVVEEAISVFVADVTSGVSTAVVLLDNYNLKSKTKSLGQGTALTLRQAIINYISDATYSGGKRTSYPWKSLPLAPISVLVKEWSNLLSHEAATLETINDLISEVPWVESKKARARKVNEIRKLHSQIAYLPSFFKTAIRDIDITKELLEQCNADTDGFNSFNNPDSKLMAAELQQLSMQANQAERENDKANERAIALALAPGSTWFNRLGDRRNKQTDSDDIASDPEPGPGGSKSHDRLQTRIDQIAFVTSGLLSLSFITSVYGMNLDIFTNGGNVSLAKFLYTALPFAFGIFSVTFGPQFLKEARMARSFKLQLV